MNDPNQQRLPHNQQFSNVLNPMEEDLLHSRLPPTNQDPSPQLQHQHFQDFYQNKREWTENEENLIKMSLNMNPLAFASPELFKSSNMDFRESPNVLACLFTFCFKLAIVLCYFVIPYISNNVVLFEIIILLSLFDFWIVKNYCGRLLIGLRWWVEINENGKEQWVFETSVNTRNTSLQRMHDRLFWFIQVFMGFMYFGLFVTNFFSGFISLLKGYLFNNSVNSNWIEFVGIQYVQQSQENKIWETYDVVECRKKIIKDANANQLKCVIYLLFLIRQLLMNKSQMFANPLLVPNQSELNHISGLFKNSYHFKQHSLVSGNTSQIQMKDYSSEALKTFPYKFQPRCKRRSFLEFQKNSFSLPKRQENLHRSEILDLDNDDSPKNNQNKQGQYRHQILGQYNKQEYRRIMPIIAKKEVCLEKQLRVSTQSDKEEKSKQHDRKVKRLDKVNVRPKSNYPKEIRNVKEKEKDKEDVQRSKSMSQMKRRKQRVKQELSDDQKLRDFIMGMQFIQNLLLSKEIDEEELVEIINRNSFKIEIRIFCESFQDGSKLEKKVKKYIVRKILREKEINQMEIKYSGNDFIIFITKYLEKKDQLLQIMKQCISDQQSLMKSKLDQPNLFYDQ